MIEIDGSHGEGGGQVLRSALSLSILTHRPIHITRIRAGRSKPGLMAQHLKSVQAAGAICGAAYQGAALNSQELYFEPGEVKAGRYHFDIGTAGAVTLVLQTIFLPLSLAGGTSQVTLIGGTHVPHSPCFHYLDLQWLPYMRRAGFQAQLNLEQAGFYPRGGGRVTAVIKPASALSPLHLQDRRALARLSGLSAVANLDKEIAKRQKHQALRRLEPRFPRLKIRDIEMPSPGKGTFLLLLGEFEQAGCCYFSLGEQGKRAEHVADEAVNALEAYLVTSGAIDQYLADQLLLPLAFAPGPSILHTSQVTQHLLTNAWVIGHFLEREVEIKGNIGEEGWVEIKG